MALTKNETAAAAKGNAALAGGDKPANIPSATEFAPSGAPIQTTPDVDPKNMAVDDNPRANTTVEQNQIDWNDPRPDMGHEAVATALNEQGVPTNDTTEPTAKKAAE